MAAWLTGSATAAIGPMPTMVSQTPVAPVSRQAAAVTTGLNRTATQTMVRVSRKVVGVAGCSQKPNPKITAVAAVTPSRLAHVGRGRTS